MKALAIIIAAIFVAGMALAGCIALVNRDDSRSLGRVELVSHDYECRSHDCGDNDGGSDGNTGYDGEGGQGGDTDQRGDHNCRNFCFYGVPIPGGGEQPQSLFPPTPDGVRQFVLSTIQGGIELGRLFSDATITFVSNLLVGIA